MTPPPRRPVERLPALAPAAARRLVRLDVQRGLPDGGVLVEAEATDLLGTVEGPRRLGQARLRVEVDGAGRVVALRSWPAVPGGSLLGVPVVGGLRAAARRLLGSAEEGPAPLGALLDDVPVAVLVSGYLGVRAGRSRSGGAALLRDVCAGWRADQPPLVRLRDTGTVPVPDLAPVPDARLGLDLPPLPPDCLRRVRWVTVAAAEVTAGFRDTCRAGDDDEGVLHEYALTARLDPDGAVRDLRAEPRVLPFGACLAAVPEVAALDGLTAAQVSRRVPHVLAGPRGCTHLNDLVRALSCTPRLARALAA